MTTVTPKPPRPARATDRTGDRASDRVPERRGPRLLGDDTVFAFFLAVLGAALLVWRWHVADARGLPTPNGQLAWGGAMIGLAAYFVASGKVRGAVGMVQGLAPGLFARWDRRATGHPVAPDAAVIVPAVSAVPVVPVPPAAAPVAPPADAALAGLLADPKTLGRVLGVPDGDTQSVPRELLRAIVAAADAKADANRAGGAVLPVERVTRAGDA